MEWLCEVVVCAHLQSDDAVDFVSLGGQHNYRCLIAGATQFAAKRQPVIPRHHNVQDDQVNRAGREGLAHNSAVLYATDTKAFPLQYLADEITNLAVVVDDQNVG